MNENISKSRHEDYSRDIHALVKWNDGGVIHRGTILRVFTQQGIKYLEVMSLMGKRSIIRASRAKLLYSETPGVG